MSANIDLLLLNDWYDREYIRLFLPYYSSKITRIFIIHDYIGGLAVAYQGESTMTESESLDPIPDEERSMSLSHYIPVWWSSFIIVQGFATAFFAVYPQGPLNLLQAAVAMTIGATTSALFFVVNGVWGYKKGIPFVTQSRAAFGVRGSIIPNIIRVIPAIGWLGIGNWIGALAINSITMTLWGFGNVPVYFALFTLLNIALAWGGYYFYQVV